MQLGEGFALIVIAAAMARFAFSRRFVQWLTGGPTVLTASPSVVLIGDIARGVTIALICGGGVMLIGFGIMWIGDALQ
jgi:hypothetical protein